MDPTNFWKKTMLVMTFAFLFVGWSGASEASPADLIIQEQSEYVNTSDIEQYWGKLTNEYGGYFPDNEVPSFKQIWLSGQKGMGLGTILRALITYFFHEVIYNGKLLATIVVLAVFSMLLETMQSAFERNAVSKVAYAIAYMVLIVIVMNSFSVAIGYAKSAISGMTDFMVAMIPLQLALLASTGSIASVTVMHPLIVFMIHAVGTFIYWLVFPLLFFSAVLHIVSSLTDKYKVNQLANLLRSLSVGILGIFVTVFLGVISIQGATGAVADGVTIRAAKYVTGNFVPVVGRLFSDASDTVVGASLLVKNSVGLTGAVILVLLCTFPAIKILTLALIYNLSAAVMQPLGNNPMTACLGTIGKSMIYVFAALAVVGLMFFFAISIMIAAGNVSVMIR